MKILHSGDWHIGELTGPVVDGQNARLLDTVRCIDNLIETARQEQPDIIVIPGDLFDKSKLWSDTMLYLIEIAAKKLRECADIAPTVLLFGTENHDNPRAFENLQLMDIPELYIITKPQIKTFITKSGLLQIAGVPGLDKGHFRAQNPGMDPAEENQICSKLLGDVVLGLWAQLDPGIPSVLLAHYSVAGCELDNGQQHIFTQNEVILPREALAASPFDLVCLGHIHKAQEVSNCGSPTFYSGSLNGLTFNEEGQNKGFWLHEINTGLPFDSTESKFIKNPSREFLTLEVDFTESVDLQVDMKWHLAGIGPYLDSTLLEFPTVGKIVRLHYRCTDDQSKQINQKEMEKLLLTSGAFYVSEIKRIKDMDYLAKQELSENAGPLINLIQWLIKEGFTEEEQQAIVALSHPLIEAVSAKMPTGKLSGVFEPRRLAVKNYRSYKEEEFDFSKISFATVNGQNGVGKSALFMDALSDCLYEEPREGDLTGWITNGEKSGMITFEFSMGEAIWRVVRTRARSGKVTLSLQEMVSKEWADRSEPKKDDTEKKITALLGMDALTFRCCGLIMQDNYGLFLEADREDRMSVLGNILGLGIYEQLKELAKNKSTETNRELEKAKARMAELDDKLKAKSGLEVGLASVGAELAQVAGDIAGKEAELKEAEDLVRGLQSKAEKAEELRHQIETMTSEIATRRQVMFEQRARQEKAQKMLDMEPTILEKSAEYETIKEMVTILRTKEPQLKDAQAEKARIVNEMIRVDRELLRIVGQIKAVETELSSRAELELTVIQYREAVASLEGMDEKVDKYNALFFKRRQIETVLDQKKPEKHGLEREIKSLQNRSLMLESSDCIDPDKASCKFLADAVESKTKIPTIEAKIVALDNEITPMDERAAELTAQIEELGYDPHEHRRLREQVSELRPKAEQAAQLSGKTELLENLKHQQSQWQEESNRLTVQVGEKDGAITTLMKELKPLADIEARLPKLEAWVKAKDELPAARQIVATATERIEAIDSEIATKEEQVKNTELERYIYNNEAANLGMTKLIANQCDGEIKELQSKQNELHIKQGGLKARLEAMQKDEEERQQVAEQMKPKAAMLTRYQTLAKAFGQDGIPFSIVRAVVPELSAQANEILGQMTGGKMAMEMRTERVQKSNKREVNALEIWINDYQRGSLPYKSRSGGQKVKAALSVAFALADLKARRAGIQLGMMFVDEPPFLDGEGSEAYCDALEVMAQRYSNMKVLAISHDLRMKARFPQQIDVIDDGENGSKVRLVA